MKLTADIRDLIDDVADGKMQKARLGAIRVLQSDTAYSSSCCGRESLQKLYDCSSAVLPRLSTAAEAATEIIQPYSFRPDMYYTGKDEETLAEKIIKTQTVSEKLYETGIRYNPVVLLTGESGTGKSEFMKYLSWKMKLPLLSLRFSSLISSYLGRTAETAAEIFRAAESTPCILFIDEIDCIACRRSPAAPEAGTAEIERITITLMQELDRLPASAVFAAATNRPDFLDQALLRRFTIRHEIKKFDRESDRKMAEKFLGATGTGKYITESEIESLLENSPVQGKLIADLSEKIGLNMYESLPESVPPAVSSGRICGPDGMIDAEKYPPVSGGRYLAESDGVPVILEYFPQKKEWGFTCSSGSGTVYTPVVNVKKYRKLPADIFGGGMKF